MAAPAKQNPAQPIEATSNYSFRVPARFQFFPRHVNCHRPPVASGGGRPGRSRALTP